MYKQDNTTHKKIQMTVPIDIYFGHDNLHSVQYRYKTSEKQTK